ncbi:hypothetical protein [Alteromonas sp. ASW11-130]|uniref:hypothetical protein n=1 Tax=Alteromonas sp. ASW11-130 TaxID=3015775 RepID=UPI002242ACD2|nr:hypothetical protein [Alteromonas sp. ASW11-130]MCW8092336.1 hypothetical protein [Alteromonas sp. ASW11-130]
MTRVDDTTQEGLELTGIFVTYNMPDEVCNNVRRFVCQFPRAKALVVDNAPNKSKRSSPCLEHRLTSLGAAITYIPSTFNCRFNAYNMALQQINTPNVVFRTDDDSFDESQTCELLNRKWTKFAISPYYYDDKLFYPSDHRHPLEIGIYETDYLKSFTPFSHIDGSDWAVLQKLYQDHEPFIHSDVILHKVPHGRDV